MQHARRTGTISEGLYKLVCTFTLAVHLHYIVLVGGVILSQAANWWAHP